MGCDGLTDASSRPALSPKAISAAKALAIVELRHKRLTQARIAAALGVAKSTVSRVLARAGLSRLSDLQPAEPVVRAEHEEPGQMLHIDTKKLGRIERPSHRVTGNRRDSVDGAGWEMLFVAIDDTLASRLCEMHPDERTPSAVQFLHNCVAYFRGLGVQVQRLLTDNGSAFRSRISPRPADNWASSTSSHALTDHRPTARLIYIDKIVSKEPLRIELNIGSELLYCTGLGKAIAAFKDEDISVANYKKFTKNTITSDEELKESLKNIKRSAMPLMTNSWMVFTASPCLY